MSASVPFELEPLASLFVAMDSELNSLANGAQADSTKTLDNRNLAGVATGGYDEGEVEIFLNTFPGTPTAGASVTLYVRYSVDETTYQDAKTTTMRGVFPVPLDTAGTTAQRIAFTIPLRPLPARFTLVNNSGQALNALGNTVKIRRVRKQVV